MTVEKRELYRSSNGDRWFLARDPDHGHVFILHKANQPSGGRLTIIELADFLRDEPQSPQRQALLSLIGTLIDQTTDL